LRALSKFSPVMMRPSTITSSAAVNGLPTERDAAVAG
jgi:hypothetical protein